MLQDPDGARYEDAYREFESAYAASNSPKILGNIGYCALKLERDGEAIAAYTRYLKEVPEIDPVEATQIGRDVDTLRAGLVRVVVAVDTPNATVIDKRLPIRGESITNLYGPVNGKIELGLRPGHHIIEVKSATETLDIWDFDAKPAATLSRTVSHKPSEEPQRRAPTRVLPWIIAGVGGATLAAGGIFGALTLGKVNTIESHCPNSQCPSSYALGPAQDDAHRFIRITDALLIGGAALTAAGLGLLVFSGGPEAPRRPTVGASPPAARNELRSSLRGSFACSPGAYFATMSGAF